MKLLTNSWKFGVARQSAAFSGLRSTGLTTPSINNLTRQDGRFIVTIL